MPTEQGTEASLNQLEAVQARLSQNERDLQGEIDVLKEELRRDQDPSRMQMIQEMISVCLLVQLLESLSKCYDRTSLGKCHAFGRKRRNLRL